MTELCHINALAQKWHLAYFVPIVGHCDSQAAIREINSTVIKNSITLEATMALNTLGESNEITLRWIPAQCSYWLRGK